MRHQFCRSALKEDTAERFGWSKCKGSHLGEIQNQGEFDPKAVMMTSARYLLSTPSIGAWERAQWHFCRAGLTLGEALRLRIKLRGVYLSARGLPGADRRRRLRATPLLGSELTSFAHAPRRCGSHPAG
ncbi:hypothetical protein JRQ81_000469 [Phrynocephalus forsythii]|uniref:Uncharacterized protein n=1 Tax=Phrynocephalus forsythii TaxID=171643 RepID=A0A9Q1B827_9SAUR|nr:hypothetical protein JRQ81_000469 [Phrynocephalus forsythii]